MRFSTRELFLLAPLFLFNSWLVGYIAIPLCVQQPYRVQTIGVLRVQAQIKTAQRCCQINNIQMTDDALNQWLAHRLPANHPSFNLLPDPPRVDVWGNPHRVQFRKSADSTPRVYSTGRDGITKTDGNDLDDIRSWDDNPALWYSRKQTLWETSLWAVGSVILTLFCFWGITNLRGGSRSTAENSQPRPTRDGLHE